MKQSSLQEKAIDEKWNVVFYLSLFCKREREQKRHWWCSVMIYINELWVSLNCVCDWSSCGNTQCHMYEGTLILRWDSTTCECQLLSAFFRPSRDFCIEILSEGYWNIVGSVAERIIYSDLFLILARWKK